MTVGLISPDEGSVTLGNEDITLSPMYARARMGLSYLPQEPSVFGKLTVEDNVKAIFEHVGVGGQEINERTSALLDDLGVKRAKTKAYALSGGGEDGWRLRGRW